MGTRSVHVIARCATSVVVRKSPGAVTWEFFQATCNATPLQDWLRENLHVLPS